MAPMPELGAAADGVPSGCVPSSPRSPAPCQSENWLGLTRHCLSQSPQYCPMLVVSGCLAEVRSLLQSTPTLSASVCRHPAQPSVAAWSMRVFGASVASAWDKICRTCSLGKTPSEILSKHGV